MQEFAALPLSPRVIGCVTRIVASRAHCETYAKEFHGNLLQPRQFVWNRFKPRVADSLVNARERGGLIPMVNHPVILPRADAGCGKAFYQDRRTAEWDRIALEFWNQATGRARPDCRLSVYRCKRCGGFHISPKRVENPDDSGKSSAHPEPGKGSEASRRDVTPIPNLVPARRRA
jgi:hypothetical protein